MRSRYHDVDDTVQGLPVQLTLIGWFPRTTATLLLLSDNHLLVVKPILVTAISSQQICLS
jgi:hypothetical protein